VTDDAHAGARPSGVLSERRWAVLYDADCGFCKWLLAGLLRWDRAARLQPIALQRSAADNLLRELTPAERMASWHLISPTGERRSGGEAVAPVLRLLPGGRLPAAGLARFSRLTDCAYRWIAEHRSQLSKCVPSSAKERAAERVHEREQEHETR
jgi:predicted DCC family thiol-disulfide oxidoreductase YuxK